MWHLSGQGANFTGSVSGPRPLSCPGMLDISMYLLWIICLFLPLGQRAACSIPTSGKV